MLQENFLLTLASVSQSFTVETIQASRLVTTTTNGAGGGGNVFAVVVTHTPASVASLIKNQNFSVVYTLSPPRISQWFHVLRRGTYHHPEKPALVTNQCSLLGDQGLLFSLGTQ